MLIQRYLFREIFYTFSSVILVTLLIAVSNKFVRLVTKMSSGEMSPEVLFQAILLQVPDLLAFLLPVALFLAILLCLSKLFVENEISVMFACGLSWRPLIGVSLFLSFIIMFLSGALSCHFCPKVAQYREQLVQKEGPLFLIQTIAPGKFHSFDDRTIFYVGDLSDNRQELKHLFVVQQQDKTQDPRSSWQLVTALSGQLVKNKEGLTYLRLKEGYRYSGEAQGKELSIIEFGSYQKLVEEQAPQHEGYYHRTMPTMMLLDNPNSANLAELLWRLSIPLSAPLLALVAVPLSRVSPRQGRYSRLFVATVICIIYYNLLTISKRSLAMGTAHTSFGMWGVHLLLLLSGLLFILIASGRGRQWLAKVGL